MAHDDGGNEINYDRECKIFLASLAEVSQCQLNEDLLKHRRRIHNL